MSATISYVGFVGEQSEGAIRNDLLSGITTLERARQMGCLFEVPVSHGEEEGLPAPGNVYEASREYLTTSCVDLFIFVKMKSGGYKVYLILRNPSAFLGGFQWCMGGAHPKGLSNEEFLHRRVHAETGGKLSVYPHAYVGTYTTKARHPKTGKLISTTQVCYAALVDEGLIQLGHDQDHSGAQLYTLKEYLGLPQDQQHPYIKRVVERGLKALEGPRGH